MLRPEDNFSPSPTSRWLVSTEWLGEHLRDRNVVVVDGTYHLPTLQRDAHAEYRDGHIPGAVFFDVETVAMLREHFQVPGMGRTTGSRFRDKLSMRSNARSLGIPVPEFTAVFNDQAVTDWASRVAPPWGAG